MTDPLPSLPQPEERTAERQLCMYRRDPAQLKVLDQSARDWKLQVGRFLNKHQSHFFYVHS